MNETNGHVIEISGPDKGMLKFVWEKMRSGVELTGGEIFVGRAMAEHPLWFPIFETLGILGGTDELDDGTNPFLHLTFHIMLGGQIFNGQPAEAQRFYQSRIRRGEDSHDVIHMLIFLFQRQLALTAKSGLTMNEFDWTTYRKTIMQLIKVSPAKFWSTFSLDGPPDFHPN